MEQIDDLYYEPNVDPNDISPLNVSNIVPNDIPPLNVSNIDPNDIPPLNVSNIDPNDDPDNIQNTYRILVTNEPNNIIEYITSSDKKNTPRNTPRNTRRNTPRNTINTINRINFPPIENSRTNQSDMIRSLLYKIYNDDNNIINSNSYPYNNIIIRLSPNTRKSRKSRKSKKSRKSRK